ncbi:MAG: hypothetical protein LBJ71_03700 [Holosporaceae bacterium]|nr:hypothetical protein [Holosporaceae bacterium]
MIDEEQLEQLNASQLREVVMAICAQHQSISKSIEKMVIEKSRNSKEMIALIKKDITALKNKTSAFFNNKRTQEIIAMFDQLCDFILSLSDILPGEAFNLMKKFFEIHQVFYKKNNHYDDGIKPVFRGACLMFGKIAERANISSKEAADVIFSLFINDISNLHFSLISGFANILKDSDLKSLKSKIIAHYNTTVFDDIADHEEDIFETAFEDMGFKIFSRVSSEQRRNHTKSKVAAKIRLWLEEIADCQNNVDDYIAALAFPRKRCNTDIPDSEKREIAKRMIAAGRGEDALKWVRASGGYAYNHPELMKFEIDALEISNKSSEAQEKRLILFKRELTLDSYEELIRHTNEESRSAIKEKLIRLAVESDRTLQAMTFLAEIECFEECSQLVQKNVNLLEKQIDRFDARAIAKALQNDYPLSAILLYRMLISKALVATNVSKSTAAAKDFVLCEELSSKIAVFGRFPTHEKYLDFLKQRYKKAGHFWEKVDTAKKKLKKR